MCKNNLIAKQHKNTHTHTQIKKKQTGGVLGPTSSSTNDANNPVTTTLITPHTQYIILTQPSNVQCQRWIAQIQIQQPQPSQPQQPPPPQSQLTPLPTQNTQICHNLNINNNSNNNSNQNNIPPIVLFNCFCFVFALMCCP